MNPLYRNDRRGTYPPSYYAATTNIPAERPALDGSIRADVAIVGAGYTGLSTALHAAEKGLDVVVIDAHRAGFGASGRNGGQAGTGWNKDQIWLEKRLGRDDARKLWDLTVEAKALTRSLVARHAPDADYKPGIFHGAYDKSGIEEWRTLSEHLAKHYDYPSEMVEGREAVSRIVKTAFYKGGVMDWDAGHLHPLRYCLGLARAAEAAGVRIFERTEATRIGKGGIRTPSGTIHADHVVLAGNGYFPDLQDKVSSRVMPINSFIAATEPLGDLADEVLPMDVAVADDKFVVNYFRLSEDKRLLFGGRENYGLGFPTDILTALRARMEKLFPQIAGIGIDYHWGGTLGITIPRLPYIRRIDDQTLVAAGFSGHGVAMTGLAGKILAEAIAGDEARLGLVSKLPVAPFPGGKHSRAPLLTLAMTWFSLRDRLGI
ncbi:FAD-dependent oxidoreductase [Alphaproteobacteria bacterium GH1-50]|uniref:FAD-dependent oxidoreductase n=1 Tax=Kangsaoukella pontilimi TaxID=2691042 RepID=A0A7C9MJY8_9RHOB|nr:FAD-binding oxidoreductase [Kangsaoukella pontilimi]MXQ08135.1 FAD-dependent oxidoreductase [Kangsaoukella pontilimi]